MLKSVSKIARTPGLVPSWDAYWPKGLPISVGLVFGSSAANPAGQVLVEHCGGEVSGNALNVGTAP